MAFGLLLMDLLYGLFLAAFALVSATVGVATFRAAGSLPLPVSIVLALAGAALAWIGSVSLVAFVLPKPKPGRYPLLRHPVFFLWVVHMLLRRCLDLPPLSMLVAQSNVLRFLVLRAQGARLSFTANMAADALVLDPALVTVGPRAVLGAQCIVAGHFVAEGELRLERVVIGADVEVSARCCVGPGVVLGDRARIQFGAGLGPGVAVGEGAVIGPEAVIGPRCRIGSGARVALATVLPADTVIAPEERVDEEAATVPARA